VEPDQVFCERRRTGRLLEKSFPRKAARPATRIFAEMFLVENVPEPDCTSPRVSGLRTRSPFDLDSEFFDNDLAVLAVRKRRGDGPGSAKPDEGAALVVKFIALGVSAEIIVIVRGSGCDEMRRERCGKNVQRTGLKYRHHNHQVVFFVDLDIA